MPIAALIRRVLDERPSHRAPFSRFSEQLADFLPDQTADQTIRTVINWGRYAEVFAYDEATASSVLKTQADATCPRRPSTLLSPLRQLSDTALQIIAPWGGSGH